MRTLLHLPIILGLLAFSYLSNAAVAGDVVWAYTAANDTDIRNAHSSVLLNSQNQILVSSSDGLGKLTGNGQLSIRRTNALFLATLPELMEVRQSIIRVEAAANTVIAMLTQISQFKSVSLF